MTPKFIFVNACIPKVYKETEKYFALFAQNWIDNCLKSRHANHQIFANYGMAFGAGRQAQGEG